MQSQYCISLIHFAFYLFDFLVDFLDLSSVGCVLLVLSFIHFWSLSICLFLPYPSNVLGRDDGML